MGFHSNFHMATDRGIGSQNQLRPFPVGRSEHPFTGFNLLEITILAPAGSSCRMTAPYPGPQRSEDLVIHPSENFLCNDVPVIIGPSPNDRIQRLDQEYLGCRFGFLQDVPDFIQKALNVLSSGPDQELSAEFPDILSKEIKAFPHMRDPSLLIREFQTPFTKKFDDDRADFVFQDVFRASRHDKIIRIANHVYLVAAVKTVFQNSLQTVQSHVGKSGGDYAPDTKHNFPQDEAGRGHSALPEPVLL